MCLLLTASSSGVVAAEWLDQRRATLDEQTQVAWYDAKLLTVEGRGWTDTKAFYDRLPARAESIVRPDVWRLSRQSSGICVRFVTDAVSFHVRWTLELEALSEPTMPATAVSGLDLYVKQDGQWRWCSVARPKGRLNEVAIIKDASPATREFLLYLPLYNVVSSLELGMPVGSHLRAADSLPDNRKPIVFYGTSITQGGCASRPGMVYSAIVGRRLNRTIINLGFRSNGTMDSEFVPLFAELDPAAYVIDCLPNMTGPVVDERAEPFVKALRAKRPETPIILAEDRTYPDGILYGPRRERNQKNREALRASFNRLQSAGIKKIYYLPAENLLGDDGDATVDASHPTDLGHFRQAHAFETILREALGQSAP